jgi:hypothetical protein
VADALGVEVVELFPKAARRSSPELSFDDVIDERRFSMFAGAIAAAAEQGAEAMTAPDTDPKMVAGRVDALLDLYRTTSVPMEDEQIRQTLTTEQADEIVAVLEKLLEATNAGVRRLKEAAENAGREEDAKRMEDAKAMREQIRQWNRQKSA